MLEAFKTQITKEKRVLVGKGQFLMSEAPLRPLYRE
jgi:hypothetical protein